MNPSEKTDAELSFSIEDIKKALHCAADLEDTDAVLKYATQLYEHKQEANRRKWLRIAEGKT